MLSNGERSRVVIDIYGDPEAPGLVVVPGVMTDARAWHDVAHAIDAWPSVAVVNRRGRAPSGPLTDEYSMRGELDDLDLVIDELGGPTTFFGWSYGGLIALLAANDRPMRQVIAYEPVMRPFGAHALPALKDATEQQDWDRCVEIVNRQISGFPAAQVEALRADHDGWEMLRRWSEPLYAEITVLNTTPIPDALAQQADRVDLLIGQHNRGTAPYGTSFDDVRQRITHADIHELPDQGHLGHIQAPARLGHLLNTLAYRQA
ncbi:alpha/beta fold hydrolase [Nocardia sp. NPDC056000]|uniref:alpha/beta fold hydrolase n=1 Tax=Nocardia sp. NPDC056000 TaxID=3345674 RepID=UPI0035E03888